MNLNQFFPLFLFPPFHHTFIPIYYIFHSRDKNKSDECVCICIYVKDMRILKFSYFIIIKCTFCEWMRVCGIVFILRTRNAVKYMFVYCCCRLLLPVLLDFDSKMFMSS
jgi:hypothetical protein